MSEILELRPLTRPQSAQRFADLVETGFVPKENLPPPVQALRDRVTAAYSCPSPKREIDQDKAMGFALYSELGPGRLTLRAAADDSIWRYLSLDVLPDHVYQRNPGAPDAWFWSSRWRIWLKRTWWLIHLSWQGDAKTTEAALGAWTTDHVAQFVERPGRGFRVDLWRAIARENGRRKFNEKQFRRVMKLNTALLATFDPTISQDLIEPYAVSLFDNIQQAK